jgi:hypothetical protein
VRSAHPFFWAAFVPLGDMRGVKWLIEVK